MPSQSSTTDEVRQLICRLLQQPTEIPRLSSAEIDMTLRVARRAQLLGRLAHELDKAGLTDSLPAVIADQLESATVMVQARQQLAVWELDRIDWATRGCDAPLVLMKGCTYVSLGLPNAAGRAFADVDLLTDEGSLEDVETRLKAMGWEAKDLDQYDQNYYRNWTHELPPLVHREREVEVDLHHNVLPRTARLKPKSRLLLDSARQVAGSRFLVLSDEDIVLHAMVHLMFDSDLEDKIRDLVDVHELLTFFCNRDNAFWSRFVARVEQLNLGRPAYYCLRYCRLLLNTDVPDDVRRQARRWRPPRVVVSLMDRLVPRALYPQHPDSPSHSTAFCRLLLYVRSHWIRMPPWLLAYHLSRKFLARVFAGRSS